MKHDLETVGEDIYVKGTAHELLRCRRCWVLRIKDMLGTTSAGGFNGEWFALEDDTEKFDPCLGEVLHPRDLQRRVLKVLEHILEHEAGALRTLLETRVSVGDKFLDADDDVVVQIENVGRPEPKLGVLGIINGILGSDNRIMVTIEDDGSLSGFSPYVKKE